MCTEDNFLSLSGLQHIKGERISFHLQGSGLKLSVPALSTFNQKGTYAYEINNLKRMDCFKVTF